MVFLKNFKNKKYIKKQNDIKKKRKETKSPIIKTLSDINTSSPDMGQDVSFESTCVSGAKNDTNSFRHF